MRFSEHFIRKDRAIGDAVSTFAYGIETRAGKYHDQIDEDGATVKGYSESPISVRLIDAIASGRWTALCQADAATKRSSAVRQEIR